MSEDHNQYCTFHRAFHIAKVCPQCKEDKVTKFVKSNQSAMSIGLRPNRASRRKNKS